MPSRRGGQRPGGRRLAVKVRTARRRKKSSTDWLRRQLNDPYVAEARRQGYRSRAAWKLIQLDDKYRLLRKGQCVIDLGAAPGGWAQVAADRVDGQSGGRVIAIDITDMDPIAGVEFLRHDFLSEPGRAALAEALDRPVDVVLSDMSPATTGHRGTDHLRSMMLCEAAHEFAAQVLRPGGALVAKAFEGGAQSELMARLRQDFEKVRHVKPEASRAESPEMYIVATGFRGKRAT